MSEDKNFPDTIQVVNSASAIDWLKSGVGLFVLQRQIWMLMMLLLLVFSLLAMTVPLFGLLVLKVLAPLFMAGIMHACYLLEQNGKISVFNLFDGFRDQTAELVRLGLIYTLLYIIAGILLSWYFAVSGGQLFLESIEEMSNAMARGENPDIQMLVPPPTIVLIKSIVVWLLLSMPALMLMCFAPLLIIRYGVDMRRSVRLSFVAVWKNRAAFFRLSLYLIAVLVVFLLPLLLVMLFFGSAANAIRPLVLMMLFFIFMLVIRPIAITSLFAAHKDIFTSGQKGLLA